MKEVNNGMEQLPFDKSLLMISVTGNGAGLIESRMLKEQVPFSTPEEMVFRIQQILDIQRLPQAGSAPRKFVVRRGSGRLTKMTPSIHDPQPAPDAIRHFWLVIRSRNFSEWQGFLQVSPDGTTKRFNSIVELLRLISQNGLLTVS